MRRLVSTHIIALWMACFVLSLSIALMILLCLNYDLLLAPARSNPHKRGRVEAEDIGDALGGGPLSPPDICEINYQTVSKCCPELLPSLIHATSSDGG
jgi:hypothetical protein